MNLRLFALFLVFVVPHLNAGEQDFSQIMELPSAEREQKIGDRLSVILNRYQVKDIDPNSDDYKFLESLGSRRDVAIDFLDQLIRLTVVRTRPLDTTETYPARQLSPAAGMLLAMGLPAEEKIKAALGDPKLDPWQRLVLQGVLAELEPQKYSYSKDDRFQYESRDPDRLYPRVPRESQPPPQSTAPPPQANLVPHSDSIRSGTPLGPTATPSIPSTPIGQQNRLSPWLIVAVLVGLFILTWLLIRRQK